MRYLLYFAKRHNSVISICIVNFAPRKKLAIAAFSIVLVISLVLSFIWEQNQEQVSNVSENILVLILVFVLEFALTSQYNFETIYINELYPTQVRMFSIGLVKTMGASILLLEPQIINACLSSGFKIMILFCILSALSIVCSYILPQTLGKTPPDVIEELRTRPESNSKAIEMPVQVTKLNLSSKPVQFKFVESDMNNNKA